MKFARQGLSKWLIFAVFLALLPATSFSNSAEASTCSKYKIGYQGPLIGPEAQIGIQQLSGVQLALQKFLTSNPSITNVDDQVLRIDDQGDPAIAPGVVTTALADNCLLGVVGPAYSGAMRQSLPLYEEKSVPIITPSAINPNTDFSKLGPNTFNRIALMEDILYTDLISEIAISSPGATVAYIYSYELVSDRVMSKFKPRGLNIATFPLGMNDYSQVTQKIDQAKALGATKVIIDLYLMPPLDLGDITEYAKSSSIGMEVIFGPLVSSTKIEAELPNPKFEGVKYFPQVYKFNYLDSIYKDENSYEYAPESFDAAYFLLSGIKGGAVTRPALSTFVRNNLFRGITGEIGFGTDGEVLPRTLPRFVIQNSKIVVSNPSQSKANGNLSSVSRNTVSDNFKFKVIDWNSQNVDYQVFIFNSSFNHTMRAAAGQTRRINLPNGTSIVEAYPQSDPQSINGRKIIYEVTVTSGSITSVKNISVSPNLNLSISGDTYLLPLAAQNTEVTIDTDKDITNGTLEISATGFAVKSITSSKKLSYTLDADKVYNFTFYAPSDRWELVPTTRKLNVTLSGATPYQVSITPDLANVIASVDPFPSTGGTAHLLQENSSGVFTAVATRSISAVGKVGFKANPGSKVKIRFVPMDGQLGEVTTPEYTVPASGNLEIAPIPFAGQNVSGTVSLEGGGVMSAGYFEVNRVDVNPIQEVVISGNLSSTGQFVFRVPTGTYDIYIEPGYRSFPDFSVLKITCVVTDANALKTCNGESSKKKVTGTITTTPSEEGALYYAYSRRALSNGYIEYASDGSAVSSAGKYGFQKGVTEAGSYIFSLTRDIEDPSGSDDYFAYGKGYTTPCEVGASPTTCDFNLVSNFRYQVFDSATNSLRGKSITHFYWRRAENQSLQDLKSKGALISRYQKEDIESVSLPNGNHILTVTKGRSDSIDPFSVQRDYLVSIANNAVSTVTDLSTQQSVIATNGVYRLTTPNGNFKGRIMDGEIPLNGSTYKVTRLADQYQNYFSTGSTSAEFELLLATGAYEFEVIPSQPTATRTVGRYLVNVASDGVVTMSKKGSGELIAASNGVFPLRFSAANLIGSLTQGGKPLSGWIYWRKLIAKDYWNWETGQDVGSSGGIFANFLPGKYRAQISIYDPDTDRYEVLIGPSCDVPETGSVTCNVALPSSAVVATISVGGNVQTSGIYARTVAKSSNADPDFDTCCITPSSQTGKFDFLFLDGNYEITFEQQKTGGNNSRTFIISVQNQQVTSFKAKNTGESISPVNGVYALSFLPANLSGTIKSAGSGSNLDLSSKGGTIEVQKWTDGKYWAGIRNLWVNSANYELRIEGEGKYRLYFIPNSSEEFSPTYSQEFYVNSTNQVSTQENSGFTNSLSSFHVLVNSNNVLFKVLNPITNQALGSGHLSITKVNSDQSREYVTGLGLWPSRNGLVGAYLPTGNYELYLSVYNNSDLSSKRFTAQVTDTSTVVVKDEEIPVPKDGERFVLKPFSTNVKGRVLDQKGNVFGSTGNVWAYANVQRYEQSSSSWNYFTGGASVNSDGYFGLRISSAGKYRVVIDPGGDSSVAQTITEEFEVTAGELPNFLKDFGSITLNAPNFKISVIATETGTALTNVYVGLVKISSDPKFGNQHIKGLYPDSEGVISGYLGEVGRYQFEINPPTGDSAIPGTTRKNYMATVTQDNTNKFVVAFDTVSGVTTQSGITKLQLGGSNLRGVVYSVDGTTPVRDTHVIPFEVLTSGERQRWDLAAWTDSQGRWSINLPSGNFKIKANAPYGSATQASSLRIGNFVVSGDGTITSSPNGVNPLNVGITLRVPNWRGVLKSPDGTVTIREASICINYRTTSNYFTGECLQPDEEGRFGFSIPDEAVFDGDTSIEFRDWRNLYPALRLVGKAEIEAFLGVSATNKEVRLPTANIEITVTGSGTPQRNVWVYVDRPGVEWIGAQNTNEGGLAGVYASNLDEAFRVRVNVPIQTSAINQNYVSTARDYSAPDISAGKVNGIFKATIALPTPNIKGVIRAPIGGGSNGEIALGSYINIYDNDRGEWVDGTGVAQDGTFAIFLKGGCCESRSYTLIVQPGYDKNTGKQQKFIRKEYLIEVSTSNVATIKDKTTDALVSTEAIQGVTLSTIYLGAPNVTGIVLDPTNKAVQGSEIYVWGDCSNWWGCYSYTDEEGKFGLSLSDGDYTIGARTPWGNSEFSDSLRCGITVSGGIPSNKTGNCIQSDKSAKLSLRAPNLTFTLMDGANPLRDAYVYMNIGGWSGNARTDRNGRVAILVDDDAIAQSAANYNQTTFTPYISVWMWGGSNENVIPWHCAAGENKPICNQLTTYTVGTPFAVGTQSGVRDLGSIQGATFNTRIKVLSPDNTKTVRNYAYVAVIRFDQGFDNWYGWSETNFDGYGRFSFESSTALAGAKFKVRVSPPYEFRSSMVEKFWDNGGAGYSLEQLNNLELTLGTPNFKLAVVAPNGSTPNRWGWYSLEVYDSTTAQYKWVNGTGLDYAGTAAGNLESSRKYRLVAYPGGGRSGSATTCILNVNSSAEITFLPSECIGASLLSGTLTLPLARGNVVGTVFAPDGTTPISGAIIYADIKDAPDSSKALTTCTLADGTYGITLDPNYEWVIRVYPANGATGPQYYNKLDLSPIQPQNNLTTTFNITLTQK